MKQRISLTYLLLLAVALVPISAASAQTACNVTYTISPQGSSQFGAAIGITNAGSTTLSGWSLTWSFANGQTIAGSWNGVVAQSGGNVTVREQTGQIWEDISPGGTYMGFGFHGTCMGTTNAVPTNFAVNGVACNGGAATPGFMLTLSPSQVSVAPGGATTDSVTVMNTGGFNGTVTLSASSSNCDNCRCIKCRLMVTETSGRFNQSSRRCHRRLPPQCRRSPSSLYLARESPRGRGLIQAPR